MKTTEQLIKDAVDGKKLSYRELTEARASVRNRMKEIIHGAEEQNRGLKSAEKNEFDRLDHVFKMLSNDVEIRCEEPQQRSNGKLKRVLGSDPGTPWLGRAAIAAYSGKQYRGITTSSGSGSIDTDVLQQEFIEAIENANQLAQAGARIETVSDNTKWAHVTGVTTASFVAEGAASSEDTGTTISNKQIDLKTMRTDIIRISREYADDASGLAERIINNSIMKALNDKFISTVFTGDGSSEPQGLNGLSDVNFIDAGGALSNYDKFVDAIKKMGFDNVDMNNISVFHSPEVWGQLGKLQDLDNNYQTKPQVLSNVPFYTTNAITTSGGTTDAYCGDWSQLVIGIRGPVTLELVERYADTLEIGFIAYLRMDLSFWRPTHFARISGITSQSPTT